MASTEQTLKVAIDFTQIGLAQAIVDVAKERQRQVEVEGWTAEHDDAHTQGQLARAASAYAYLGSLPDIDPLGRKDDRARWEQPGSYVRYLIEQLFPSWGTMFGGWDWGWFKPTDRRRDLVKAAALIVAEIERLDRMAALTSPPAGTGDADGGGDGNDDHPDVAAQRAVENAATEGELRLGRASPMDSAPKDGTLLRLIVRFAEEPRFTGLEDTLDPHWTIGFNQFDDTGIDEWQFVGWDWTQDAFIDGIGTPLGWLPLRDGSPEIEEKR